MQMCGGKLSLRSMWSIADQSLTRIEKVHERFLIHRDIKPDNLAIGLGRRSDTIYILDFGLAKQYRSPKTKKHIPYKENKDLTGSIRYASLNTHLGIEQARRDDLESLGFVYVYLTNGKLPWQGLPAKDQEDRYRKVLKIMSKTTIEELCKDLPGI